MRLITIDDARRAAQDAVALKGPDYVYERPSNGMCSYVDFDIAYDSERDRDVVGPGTQRPSCLVGHMFINAWGVSPEIFAESGDDFDRQYSNDLPVYEAITKLSGLEFTTEAAEYMKILQDYQDNGSSWGTCLIAGDDYWNEVQ